MALIAPSSAFAYYDFFYGWSPDGSFYARAGSGTDLMEQPSVCLSDAKAGSKTWPAAIPRPTEGDCTSLCNEETYECQPPETASALVSLPKPSRRGPNGETIAVKIAKKGTATVTVMAGGKKVASEDVELHRADERPGIREVYWRPGGGAVAVFLGYPDPPGDQDGYPPPRYLSVMTLGRAVADAVPPNTVGVRLLKAKDYPGAIAQFRKALAENPSHVLAHYNLACAAALSGDRKTAVAELRWLRASKDPAARKALGKARSDSDLKSVRADPEVVKLVGPKPTQACDDACESKRDRCENECYNRHDDEGLRGCVRLCGSALDECQGKCR